jgi:hypothetical protein
MRSQIRIWIYIRIRHDLRVNHSWSTTLYFDFGLTRKKLINCMVYTCTTVGWPTVQLGSEYTRSAGAGHKDPRVIHTSSNYQPITPPGCQVGDAICWNIWLETCGYGTECAWDRISKNGVCCGWTVQGRNVRGTEYQRTKCAGDGLSENGIYRGWTVKNVTHWVLDNIQHNWSVWGVGKVARVDCTETELVGNYNLGRIV